MASETTIKTADAVKSAINAGAFGSDYCAARTREVEEVVRVHVTHRGKDVGYVSVLESGWSLGQLRLHAAAHGKADGWLRKEMRIA